jgi:glycosyltransferase involved in cell wall biosynthesis
LGSQSWVKGFDQAEKWCKDNNLDYEVVWNLPYAALLEKLAQAEGFVYLPNGADTCPRMVIEAKLLGCKLHLNDFVQHAREDWFDTQDIIAIEEYLYSARSRFWNFLKGLVGREPTISGYTTTYNCVSQKYPFEQSIKSMLAFCDEVVVVDGNSTDGTWERLYELKRENPKLKLVLEPRDWNHPRFAVFDGEQKAVARKHCSMEYCWQMDSDEIVHEDDVPKIKTLIKQFPKAVNMIALPVVEYWGGYDKVRCDINPWKWRVSRNLPTITHGIPRHLRKTDAEGNLYAAQGTDGCDLIDTVSGDPVPFLNFFTDDVNNARVAALTGNEDARAAYEKWFNQAINALPGVFHFSWFDLPRKIRTYRGYWAKHWKSLFDIDVVDTAENNMMFDVPWSEVTEEMIDQLAERLGKNAGGWVWHRKWPGTPTPHVVVDRKPPVLATEFYGVKK